MFLSSIHAADMWWCFFFQAFKYFPSNIATISWLGAYYIDAQFIEKAMHYFERAALVQLVFSLLFTAYF